MFRRDRVAAKDLEPPPRRLLSGSHRIPAFVDAHVVRVSLDDGVRLRVRAAFKHRDELLTEVWGYRKNMAIETRTVDIHVAKLRRKIEPVPKTPTLLITVRGAGYRLMIA